MERRLRHRNRVSVVLLWSLLTTASVVAQTTGSIAGRVADPAGAALPGVTVEARSSNLQGARTRVTGAYGEYRFPALPPGTYRVRASLSGFRAIERTARVAVDATATLDLTLQIASSESVTVSGDVPFVDTSSTTSMTSYTAAVMQHLPCGRNYSSIVEAAPGVSTDRGATQARSLGLAIKGATSAENQWNVDGLNTTDIQRGIQGKAINNELVEEVDVVTGGYQAEYGRALGGVINVVTKSGGNAFHGDGFAYYDSSAMAARPVITADDDVIAKMRIADYSRQDYGADLGGYVVRDRVWFFAAYDRVDLPAQVSPTVSSTHVSSSDQFPLDATTTLYSGKLTWNAAAGTSLVGSLYADPTTNSGAGAADPSLGYGSYVGGLGFGPQPRPITNPDPSTWRSTLSVGGTDLNLRATQLVGARGVMELQLGRHEDRFQLTPSGNAVRTEDWTCPGGTPDNPCATPTAPNSVAGGFGSIVGFSGHAQSQRGQYRVDGSLYGGDHTLKAGGDYQDARTDTISSFTGGQLVQIHNEQGQPYYVHQFFAAGPDDLTPVKSASTAARVRDYGAYIQDSWRPAAAWTVNAGLRWDRESVLDSRFASYIQTTKLQPRLGVVWDPGKDGKTKISAFAGRFFWGLPTDLGVRIFSPSSPTAITFNFDPVGVASDPSLRGPIVFGGGAEPVEPNLQAIYQDELSIGIERQFGSSLSVGLKGTYRRLGNSIEDRCDLDPGAPINQGNVCAIVNPGSGGLWASGNIPGCNGLDGDAYQCVDAIPATPPARRLYRGIELLARKSLGEKLWMQASYVYSSLRGNYDGAINESTGQTDPGVNADFDYYLLNHDSYGRLFLDQPHRFRLDGYYTTPFGLSVGLQAFVASGVPLDKLGYFDDPLFAYGAVVRLVPRGYAGRTPTQWEGNLTLSYPIAVKPVTITLQGYVYNLFNNQIPTFQRTDWTTSPPPDYPASLYDPNQPQNNPQYGKVVTRQDPRLFRAAVRVSF